MAEHQDHPRATIIGVGRPGIGANKDAPRQWRSRGFAKSDGLPDPVRVIVTPYLTDSRDFHVALLSSEESSTFLELPTDVQAKLLWLGDQAIAVAIDSGAERENAINDVATFVTGFASIIPSEESRG